MLRLTDLHRFWRPKLRPKAGGNNGFDAKEPRPTFAEEAVAARCPAAFKYVAVILERDSLGMAPTKLVYGKMYPPVGIDVSEGKCAVLVGKKIADKISKGRSGFLEVDPLDIIELKGQQQMSDKDVGKIVDRAPSPLLPIFRQSKIVLPNPISAGASRRIQI